MSKKTSQLSISFLDTAANKMILLASTTHKPHAPKNFLQSILNCLESILVGFCSSRTKFMQKEQNASAKVSFDAHFCQGLIHHAHKMQSIRSLILCPLILNHQGLLFHSNSHRLTAHCFSVMEKRAFFQQQQIDQA